MRYGLLAGCLLALGCLSDATTDQFPPVVGFITPLNGETVSGQVTINVEALDETGIALVRIFADDTELAEDTQFPYSTGWNTLNEDDGTHVLSAEAEDTNGNTRTVSITVTVDNTPG